MRNGEPPYDFEDLGVALQGMLPADVYQEYYRLARDRSRGSILELGTGQGASTVSFALGIKDSGRSGRVIAIDQFSQEVRGPHPASRKTHGETTLEINLRAFEAGLRKYGVNDYVDVHVGKTTEVEVDAAAHGMVDVLAIDVDGMLDRDLARFYDRLSRGGVLILDDCADTITDRERRTLADYREHGWDGAVAKLDRLSSFQRRRLLGKHRLVQRLVERFEALGLLEQEYLMGWTLFARKTSDASFSERWSHAYGDEIEQSIVDDFLELLRHGGEESASAAPGLRQWLRRVSKRLTGRGT